MRQWAQEPGVWSVGVGHGMPKPGKWAGHLLLRAGDHLIDPTIDQADRPSHGIRMPGVLLVTNVPGEFWRGEERIGIMVNGCNVSYQARPSDNSYLRSPSWSGRSEIEREVSRELLRFLRSKGRGKSLGASMPNLSNWATITFIWY